MSAFQVIQGNAQHPSYGLGRTPEQLVSHRKSRQVFGAHVQLSQTAYGDGQGPGNCRGGQTGQGLFLLIGHDSGPSRWHSSE